MTLVEVAIVVEPSTSAVVVVVLSAEVVDWRVVAPATEVVVTPVVVVVGVQLALDAAKFCVADQGFSVNRRGPCMGPVVGWMRSGVAPVTTSNCVGPQRPLVNVMVVVPAGTSNVTDSAFCCGHGQKMLLGMA